MNNNNSRTKNVTRNTIIGWICQSLNLIFAFISRTVFIRIFGEQYLGISGLFSNILNLLSFAELGIGNAIVFSMYKPIAENDINGIKALLTLYKKTYNTVSCVITVVGIAIIPFVKNLWIGKVNIPENITYIYILFLLNSSLSYLFSYKKTLISADQRHYIVNIISQISHLLKVIIQIAVLTLYKNYYVFLVIEIVYTVSTNIALSILAIKSYPFLKNNHSRLDAKSKKKIFDDVKSLAVYRLGLSVSEGADNIIISAMIDVATIGFLANYQLFTATSIALLGNVLTSFTASVGNLNAVESDAKKYDIFKKIFLITVWLFGYAAIGIFIVSKDVIKLWIGERYVLPDLAVFAMVLNFYMRYVDNTTYLYRTTLGFFKQARWCPAIGSVINIILSIALCKMIGLAGILFATSIARALTSGIYDPILIYKNTFQRSPLLYYAMYFKDTFCVFCLGCLCKFLCTALPYTGVLGVAIQIIIITLVYNGGMMALFCRTDEFKGIISSIYSLFRKKRA